MRAFPAWLACSGLMILAICAGAEAASFKHVVIIFQENRTPDNLFGSNPRFEKGVDIATAGVNSAGQTIPLTALPLASCYDIDHSHQGFENALTRGADKDQIINNHAACMIPSNPQFKYADNSAGGVQPYFDLATQYGFANRMFQTNQGPSFPAHQFIFGGTSQPSTDSPLFAAANPLDQNDPSGCAGDADQTVLLIDGSGNMSSNAPIFPCFEHPVMSDLLDRAGLSWRYYASSPNGMWTAPNAISHVCGASVVKGVKGCNGPDWRNGSVQGSAPYRILKDVQNCNLAAVSWVTPTAANSDHATVTDGSGPQWVAMIVNTIGQQPSCASGENYWQDTAVLITWDDWGGWYDHVPPPKIDLDSGSTYGWGDGFTYGFRVPLLVVSAFTPPGLVDSQSHDFGTLLYFIECNFGLGFIGPNNSIYSDYADWQAARRGDGLGAFFPLAKPRAFVPIATTLKPSAFEHQPVSAAPVDD